MTGASGESNPCIFCDTSDPTRDALVLIRGRVSFVILNLYPYNSGHLMVVPNRHVADTGFDYRRRAGGADDVHAPV